MKTRAVHKYPTPGYPTRPQALADPELLAENLPRTWRGRPEMAGAVVAFLALNACQHGSSKESLAESEVRLSGAAAPVFVHGEGRGAMGCVVVSPPAFLSEEEALQVIGEELEGHHLVLTQFDIPIEGLTFGQKEESWTSENGEFLSEVFDDPDRPAVTFTLDRATADGNVGVEFVSRKDYHDLGGPRNYSTVQGFDLLEISGRLSVDLGQREDGCYYGVFYDPMENYGRSNWMEPTHQMHATRADAKERSEELLRLQVRNFLTWLEGQGVL